MRQFETEAALEQTRAAMWRQTLPLDRWPWFECRASLYGNGKLRLHCNNNNVFSDGFGLQKLMADAMHYYHHPDDHAAEKASQWMAAELGWNEQHRGEELDRYWHLSDSYHRPAKSG